jgi:hypothetical protein
MDHTGIRDMGAAENHRAQILQGPKMDQVIVSDRDATRVEYF